MSNVNGKITDVCVRGYSKEFMDAYKERVKRVQNGEIFEYPVSFGYWPGIAMSATVLGVEGIFKNMEDV